MCYNLNVIKDRFKSLKPKGIDTMTNTTKTPKLTKMQKFQMLADLPAVKSDPTLSEFVAHEMELLSKKNSGEKKLTPQQIANEAVKSAVMETMSANPNRLFTITELTKEVPGLPADMSVNRMSALVRQLKDEGKVVRIEDKRKALFRVA